MPGRSIAPCRRPQALAVNLHVETLGKGPKLVMLHGWSFSSRIWERVADELSRRFELTLIDLPGHGKSPPAPVFSYDALLERLAQELLPQAHVLGWSLGGSLAVALALRVPRRVAKLVLVAVNPRFTTCPDWPYGLDPDVLSGFRDSLAQDAHATVQRFLALVTRGSATAAAELRYLRGQLRRSGLPDATALAAGLDVLRDIDLRARLTSLAQPTLLVYAENDALVPADLGPLMRRQLPQSRLVTVASAGHAPFLSRPQAFTGAVGDFLA